MPLLLLTLLAAAPVPAAAAAPAPAAAAAPAAEAPTFLRLRAVGDVMLGSSVPEGHLPPDDGAHLLEAVSALVADADLTFANLEGPLCDSGSSNKCRKGSNCFAFRSPTAYGKYLTAMGLDVVSTANNHNGDFGDACKRETEKTLDALGIAWSGPPGTIASLPFKGKKVAVVAFHTSDTTNDVNNLPAARELVKQAKAANALVIVSFHGGAEGPKANHVIDGAEQFLKENRGDLKAFTHAVIDAGADLVIGHGPHVVRAMELYKGRLIAYSLGNFATYGRFSLGGPLGVSTILEVELAEDGHLLRGKLLPTLLEGLGVPKPDPAAQAVKAIRELTAADFPKTGAHVAEDGTIAP